MPLSDVTGTGSDDGVSRRRHVKRTTDRRQIRLYARPGTALRGSDNRRIANLATQPRQHLTIPLVLNSHPPFHSDLHTCIYIQYFEDSLSL
jgi:hypothetical protein